MAITIRILVEVVLMILLSSIEILQRQFLYGQGLLIVLLLFGKHLLDDWHQYDSVCPRRVPAC